MKHLLRVAVWTVFAVAGPAFAQALSPGLLSFTGTVGTTNPAPQNLNIATRGLLGSGPGTFNWTISVSTSDGGNWLSVSSTSGSGAATVSVSIDATALPKGGVYNGAITLNVPGGSSVTRVYVQMCSPLVIVSPSFLLFEPGIIAPTALGITEVGCPNLSTLPSVASVSVSTTDGRNWLSATAGPPGLTFVSVNQNGLSPGIYNGLVTLKLTNGATSVTTVTSNVGRPAFTVAPSAYQFLARPGTPNPAPQTMSVSFPSASTPPSWTVSAKSDSGNWLSAFPASGSGPGTAQLYVNQDGLGPGVYYGTLTVNASSAGTVQARVTLEVLGNDTNAYTNSYYFPHLVTGGGWQTTLTYVNYSPQRVWCQANFHSDLGGALNVFFAKTFAFPSLSVVVEPGGSFHVETQADLNAPLVGGWADAQCTGPVKASLLFRQYNAGVAVSEASATASTPASAFATFAQIGPQGSTGFALANPSTQAPALVTFTAFDTGGQMLATRTVSLGPRNHSAVTTDQLFVSLSAFTGSVRITSTVPILGLALNLEANPVFSSLPPAELFAGPFGGPVTYYFPHLVFGGGWQTTLTYVNDSPLSATCRTSFMSDSGAPLFVSFSDQSGTQRTDEININGSVHQETQTPWDPFRNAPFTTLPVVEGWATAVCSAPVKASLLFRLYNAQGAVSEAGINAIAAPASEFATFAQVNSRGSTGIAYANPSALPATMTIVGLNGLGIPSAPQVFTSLVLPPRSHGAATVDTLGGVPGLFFTGSIEIISTVPIILTSLNFEAAPTFSSLPPAELPASTPMAAATGP